MKNFLTGEQKMLLKFDNTNVISSGDDLGSDRYESDIDKMHERMIEDLWHTNGLVGMFTLGKISKILLNYPKIEKLHHFDINLIKSFYSKDHLQEMYKSEKIATKIRNEIFMGTCFDPGFNIL